MKTICVKDRMLALVHAIFGLNNLVRRVSLLPAPKSERDSLSLLGAWRRETLGTRLWFKMSRYVLSHWKSELIVSWNPWLTSLLRLYRKACYANKPRGPVSILSVFFFFLFVDFVGITALEASVFPQSRWWLFFRAVSHQLYGNPNNHYLFVPH